MVSKLFSQSRFTILSGLLFVLAVFVYLKADLAFFEHRLLVGKNPRFSHTNLPDYAIEYGKTQAKAMLKDRPGMSKYVNNSHFNKAITEDDSIWQWLVRKFAGEDAGELIDWNPKYPPYGWLAVNRNPVDRRSSISINIIYTKKTAPDERSIGKEVRFEDLWACAVFELLNVIQQEEFHKIFKQAAKGKITREEFVMRIARVEFETVKKSKQFYFKVWKPWAKKHRFSISPDSLFLSYATAPTDSEYGYMFFGRKSYFDFYRNIYDKYFGNNHKEES